MIHCKGFDDPLQRFGCDLASVVKQLFALPKYLFYAAAD